MEGKELRIGNLVNHSELGIVEVIAVGKDYIHCIFNGETFYESVGRFSPIPLTLEWLLKFGFKAMEEGEYTYDAYSKGGIQIWHQDKNKLIIEKPDVSYPLQYVHQVQNLHFALKGEELQIKKDG